MISDPSILDLTAWAGPLGAIFSQALAPLATTLQQQALAEQACGMLEEAAAGAPEAPDEPAPWRALHDGAVLHLALDDGLAFAQFDGPDLVSLRVELDDGRRWTVIRTGRGILEALDSSGPGPDLKVAVFEDQRMVWSHSYYADGRAEDDRDPGAAAEEARGGTAQEGALLGAAGVSALGAAVLGAGVALARKALAQGAPAPVPSTPPRTGPAWRVVALSGPVEGRDYLIQGPTVLGRDASADIVLDDRSASRRHAELRPTPRGLMLTDLESSNGTWLGEAQLFAPLPLKAGDVFAIGTSRFLVEAQG
ncbi:MAG TPA: FHA domain-containing protein, partial [Holophaga sp.]|nr:FHA domain-containing protein [Holophaga sp.]